MRVAALASIATIASIAWLSAFAADAQSTPATQSAPAAQPEATAQPVSATDDPNKLICHHPIHEGAMLTGVECHTQRQWDRIRHDTQRAISDFQMRSLQESPR